MISLFKRLFSRDNRELKYLEVFDERLALYYRKKPDFQRAIKYKINNDAVFITALTHSSYIESIEIKPSSNERLEYLGDSALSLVVSDFLFERFVSGDEGFLTKIRAHLVNKRTLAEAAESIKLFDYLFYDKSLCNSSKAIITAVSDAIEAIIAAIYLDGGLPHVRKFVMEFIIEPNLKNNKFLMDYNYKSKLLEYLQAHKLLTPIYKLLKEEGPEHNKIFTIGVYIGSQMYGIGEGKNKKDAEQEAAKKTLEILDFPNL